jgi:hypothetical protein
MGMVLGLEKWRKELEKKTREDLAPRKICESGILA